MKAIFCCAAVVLAFALVGSPARAEHGFSDWLQPSDEGYSLLKSAAREAGISSWLTEALAQDTALPMASVRELVLELQDSPRLDAQAKAELMRAFPEDRESGQEKLEKIQFDAKEIEASLKRSEERIEEIHKIFATNLYRGDSIPNVIISHGIYYARGSATGNKLSKGTGDFWQDLDLLWKGGGGYGTFTAEFYFGGGSPALGLGSIDPPFFAPSFTFNFDSEPLGPLELSLKPGKRLPLSTLIYSKLVRPNERDTEQVGLSPRADGSRLAGLYFRKPGRDGWWVFSDTQFFWAPWTSGFFDRGGSLARNPKPTDEWAGRVDLRGWELGLFGETSPYFVYAAHTREADVLLANGAGAGTASTRSWAAGLNSEMPGGGNASLEIAGSRDESRSRPGVYQDGALAFTATKNLGDFSLTLFGSEIGPEFVTGNPTGLYVDNLQGGAFLDSLAQDPRPGMTGRTAWQTLSKNPRYPVNNARRFALQGAWTGSWAKLGAMGGTMQQLRPSGPWLQFSHYFSSWAAVFPASARVPQRVAPGTGAGTWMGDYNQASAGQARWKGTPYIDPSGSSQVNWSELVYFEENSMEEVVLLTQQGVGDPELRQDSVKYFNFVRYNMQFDLKSLFNTENSHGLWVVAEAKNTDETAGLAQFEGLHLLLQTYVHGGIDLGISKLITLSPQAGQEYVSSLSSYYPVNYQSQRWALLAKLDLSPWISGFVVNTGVDALDHKDLALGGRSFYAWRFNFDVYYTFF